MKNRITISHIISTSQAILNKGKRVPYSIYKKIVPVFVSEEGRLSSRGESLLKLMKVFNGQTEDERREGVTKYLNRRGFDIWDAKPLTDIVFKIKESGITSLTDNELSYVVGAMPKYWRQWGGGYYWKRSKSSKKLS